MSLEKISKNSSSEASGDSRYKAKLTSAQEQKAEILNLLKQELAAKSRNETLYNEEQPTEYEENDVECLPKLLLEFQDHSSFYKRIKKLFLNSSKRGWMRMIRNLKKLFNSEDKSIGEKFFAIFKQFNLERGQPKALKHNSNGRFLQYLRLLRAQQLSSTPSPSLFRRMVGILSSVRNINQQNTLPNTAKSISFLSAAEDSLKISLSPNKITNNLAKNSTASLSALESIYKERREEIRHGIGPIEVTKTLEVIPSIMQAVLQIILPTFSKLWENLKLEGKLIPPLTPQPTSSYPTFCPMPVPNPSTTILCASLKVQNPYFTSTQCEVIITSYNDINHSISHQSSTVRMSSTNSDLTRSR